MQEKKAASEKRAFEEMAKADALKKASEGGA